MPRALPIRRMLGRLRPTHRSARRAAGTLAAGALALGAFVVPPAASAAPAEPQAAADFTAGTLSWGFKQSFRDYLAMDFVGGSVTPTGTFQKNAAAVFVTAQATGTADPIAKTIALAASGSVQYLGHGGVLDTKLLGIKVQMTEAGGVLAADADYRPFSGNTTDPPQDVVHVDDAAIATLAPSTATVLPDGSVSFAGVAATLTAAGATIFGNFYPAGTALDPVDVASAGFRFVEPLSKGRYLDTRTVAEGGATYDGLYLAGGPRAAETTLPLKVGGTRANGIGATPGASLNVTVVGAQGAGFLTVFPCGAPRPTASSLNFVAGDTVANTVITKVGTDASVCIYVSMTTHVIVDVTGTMYVGAASLPITPQRHLDTRPGSLVTAGGASGGGPIASDSQRPVAIAGVGPVPSAGIGPLQASAASINVTAVNPSGAGYLTVWPCDQTRPTTSTVNFEAGSTVANAAITKLSELGTLCVYASVATQVIVDVNAWLPATSRQKTVNPARLLDTRPGSTTPGAATVDGSGVGAGLRPAGSQISVPVVSRGGTPPTAVSASVNVTAANATGPGYVLLYDCSSPRPATSTLNLMTGGTTANLALSALSTGAPSGSLCVYFAVSSTHLIVDVTGYQI